MLYGGSPEYGPLACLLATIGCMIGGFLVGQAYNGLWMELLAIVMIGIGAVGFFWQGSIACFHGDGDSWEIEDDQFGN